MNNTLIFQLIGYCCGGIVILAFAGAGVFLLIKSFKDRKKAEASQGWPATQGQILEARIAESTSTDSDGDTSTSYSPAVKFTYNVAGQEYKGNKITFGFTQGYRNYAKAQAALARYPLGAQVTIYYDPANPADAVLERKAGGNTLAMVLGIILLAISLCLGCPMIVMIGLNAISTLNF
ncbi:MAG: DUF3592 domain-containing protein [Anaerolineales bacterium]|nr:DUF3592 domain-containing protein [Anaerolineales bacterium]